MQYSWNVNDFLYRWVLLGQPQDWSMYVFGILRTLAYTKGGLYDESLHNLTWSSSKYVKTLLCQNLKVSPKLFSCALSPTRSCPSILCIFSIATLTRSTLILHYWGRVNRQCHKKKTYRQASKRGVPRLDCQVQNLNLALRISKSNFLSVAESIEFRKAEQTKICQFINLP